MRFFRYLVPVVMITVAVTVIIFCYSSIKELDFSLLNHRSRVLYAADGSVAAYTLSSDTESYRFYTRVDDVSPLYLRMLIAGEDRNFFSHPGVDVPSLFRAFITNIKNGHVTSGGSTLAMQVAKKLTGHERTYFNKLKEIVQAVYLTQKYGRRQILEWYMTLAPFGSNIEGVNAASLKWFNHLPKSLSPSEAALLTALPRAPEIIRPDRSIKSTLFYKNEALRLSYEKGVISRDVWQASLKDDLPHQTFKISQTAFSCMNSYFERVSSAEENRQPQAPDVDISSSDSVSSAAVSETGRTAAAKSEIKEDGFKHTEENPSENGSTPEPEPLSGRIMEIHSYLDPFTQNILQQEGERFHALHNDGAVLSAIVLDADHHRVTGILGSSDLGISQICLPFAQRSPGSALKPFAYGMAFEQHKLHPYTTLHDNRKLFGTWSPLNFTRTFVGKITAESALVRSLNLPAIEVLEMIGPATFVNFLNRFGRRVYVRNNQADYSVILGSVNINLFDLAQLYGMLNEDGLLFRYPLSQEEQGPSEMQWSDSDSELFNYINNCDPIYEGKECRLKMAESQHSDKKENSDRKTAETLQSRDPQNNQNDSPGAELESLHLESLSSGGSIISGTYRTYPIQISPLPTDKPATDFSSDSADNFRQSPDADDLSSAGRFFYADTARAVFKILQKASQPLNSDDREKISYKTGTSSRYTDAISAGSLGNYTVAVAVRLPDNRTGFYKYSGSRDASPHLFSIFSKLKVKNMIKPEIKSELLEKRIPDFLRENREAKNLIDENEISIIFPENNTTVLPDYNGVVHIKYTGGKGTIYIVAGGNQTEGASFIPDHSGHYIVTLMDDEGHSDTVDFHVTLMNDENQSETEK